MHYLSMDAKILLTLGLWILAIAGYGGGYIIYLSA